MPWGFCDNVVAEYQILPPGEDSVTQLLAILIPIIPITAIIFILWFLHWDGLELSCHPYPFPTLANSVPWVIDGCRFP